MRAFLALCRPEVVIKRVAGPRESTPALTHTRAVRLGWWNILELYIIPATLRGQLIGIASGMAALLASGLFGQSAGIGPSTGPTASESLSDTHQPSSTAASYISAFWR